MSAKVIKTEKEYERALARANDLKDADTGANSLDSQLLSQYTHPTQK